MDISNNRINKVGLKIIKNKEIKKPAFFWGCIFFRISLDVVYPVVIVKYFHGFGFSFLPDSNRYFISYIAMITLLFFVSNIISIKKAGSIFIMLLILCAYIPNMSLFSGMSLPYSYFFLSNSYWYITIFLYALSGSKGINFNRIKLRLGGNRFPQVKKLSPYWIFFLAFFIVVFFAIYYNNGIKLTIDLSIAYKLRPEANSTIPKIMRRLISWCVNIIFPMGIIIFIKKRKWLYVIPMFIGEIFAFSVNGIKTGLFVAVISFFMIIAVRNDEKLGHIPIVFTVCNFFSIILKNSNIGYFIDNYIIRRVFFSTSLFNYFWIDFFSNKSKLWFTNSSLGWLRRFGFVLPYSENISEIIGRKYMGYEAALASGTIAQMYGNMGWWGIFIYPLLIVLIAKMIDLIGEKCEIKYIYPIIISAMEYLLNGSIYSALVTYGFIIGVIIVFYLKNKGVYD